MNRGEKLEATRQWVNKWRIDNGVGPNVTPGKDIVPFKWMHPFLNRVQADSQLKIADAGQLTNYLKSIGQDQRTGSMRGSGLTGDKLIDALKIGVEKFKA